MDYLQDLERKLQAALNDTDINTAIKLLKEINAKGIDLCIEYELGSAPTQTSVSYSSQRQFSECSDSGPVMSIPLPSPNTSQRLLIKSSSVPTQHSTTRVRQPDEPPEDIGQESIQSIDLGQKRFEEEEFPPSKRDEATSRVVRDTGRQTGREEEEAKVGYADPENIFRDYTDGTSRVPTDRSLIPVAPLSNPRQSAQQSSHFYDEDQFQETHNWAEEKAAIDRQDEQ